MRHRVGKYTWPSGAYFSGEWRDGHMSGVGKFVAPDGSRYQGVGCGGLTPCLCYLGGVRCGGLGRAGQGCAEMRRCDLMWCDVMWDILWDGVWDEV